MRVNQNLLDVLSAKACLFNVEPDIGQPVAAILRSFEVLSGKLSLQKTTPVQVLITTCRRLEDVDRKCATSCQ